MNRLFYPKLAADNIWKNAKTYIPYIITCVLTVAMYYIMKSLSFNDGLKEILGASTVAYTLSLGSNVIAIFSFIFLFYTNSFLTKKRKKEFGLFNILGMEKKHIAKIIAYESIYVAVISFIAGFLAGILLDKLMYLVITKLIGADIALGFYISKKAMLHTLILFGILFLLIFLNMLRMIHLSKPIELLRGSNVGEKEPKTKWIAAIVGLLCLGGGYYICVTVKNPVTSLTMFFVAVVLIVLGTYLLFMAGSIALLKLLKKNKRYYYQTNHFISVSGMIYRMKQNAVGLANICILSTMVLVMISSTSSLMIGIEDVIRTKYPHDIELYKYEESTENNDAIVSLIRETAEKESVTVEKEFTYTSLDFVTLYDGKDYFEVIDSYNLNLLDNVYLFSFITAEDYTAYTGEEITLSSDEVILYETKDKFSGDSFRLFDKTYHINRTMNQFIDGDLLSAQIVSAYGVIVKDSSVIQELYEKQKEIYQENASSIVFNYGIDIEGNDEEQTAFCQRIKEILAERNGELGFITVECQADGRESAFGLYGSLFFLGIFLGLLFIIATVLIIYYKQISEGYDDKQRFEIMQKVGMSRREVKSSIHSQVLTVFFLPLITAGIHVAFTFPIIRKILMCFSMYNTKLYLLCTAGSFLAFALVYGIIYLMTAKVYYKIVKK